MPSVACSCISRVYDVDMNRGFTSRKLKFYLKNAIIFKSLLIIEDLILYHTIKQKLKWSRNQGALVQNIFSNF